MEADILFLTYIIIFSFFLSTFPLSHSLSDQQYQNCNSHFNCGTLPTVGYPFWANEYRPPYCGSGSREFQLTCPEDKHDFASFQIGSQTFNVTGIDILAYKMTLVRTNFVYENCSLDLRNAPLSAYPFRYGPNAKKVTLLYDCPQNISIGGNNFTCHPPRHSDSNKLAFYSEEGDGLLQKFPDLVNKCKWIDAPVSKEAVVDPQGGFKSLKTALSKEFEVEYDVEESCAPCYKTGGVCGSNSGSQFTCLCEDGPHAHDCADSSRTERLSRKARKVIVGVAASAGTVIAMLILFYFYQRRKKNTYAKSYIQSRATSDSSLMDPENASKYFGVHVFTYSELEEATNNFDSGNELGDGGFGTVYYGELQDGRHVAVKRLYENNYKRLEQFINEVEILTRLRHTNLVSLYGCTSRHSRELLLVYEYIPNGTLADHLHGEQAKPGSLPWSIRMNIAIETASALAYLHASEIIHRDVKTSNILLDNHFVVKVADFGLSRLFPNDVTHISTAPQGTPGYVDPEYHECYQLTVKSDVYSFGVVLIELISSLPAVDITRHRHEINLSTMAINKIHNRALHELVDPTLGFESDPKVRKMINAVAELAFQCLQNLKDMRPSMGEVLETLRDIESDGKHKSKPEVMDISADDVGLLKNDLPPPSPDSNLASKSTTSNSSN